MIDLSSTYSSNIIQNQEFGEHVRVGFAINKEQVLDIFAHRETDNVVIQIMDKNQYLKEEVLKYNGDPVVLFPEKTKGERVFSDATVAIFKIERNDGKLESYVFVSFNNIYLVNYKN